MGEEQAVLPDGQERGFDWNQLIGPGIGAGAALLGSIPQMVEARRLRKERERLLKEGAPGLTDIEQQQMAEARARAASSLAPGYAQEIENISQQQSDILGAAKRSGISGSNLLNTLSRLNQQGQAARRNLVARGAQTQRSAQSELANMALTADARRQGRVQNWEAKMAKIQADKIALNAAAGMAPLQGALAFMPVEGLKFGTGPIKKPKSENIEPMQPRYSKPDFGVKPLITAGVELPYMPKLNKEQRQQQYIDSMDRIREAHNMGLDPNFLISNPIRNTAQGANRYYPQYLDNR